MKLKINYQYTYFIHPFIVKESKYQKYLFNLVKDKNVNLKVFEKGKDFELFKYFSPKTAEMLFSNALYSSIKFKKLKELANDTKAAVLSKYSCVIFEYNLPEDIQGKTDENGIFFKIQKMQIICFNTGICFLCMKTNVENVNDISDILNFNYKFKDIKVNNNLNKYDKICLQSGIYNDVNKLTEFIYKITGSDIESLKIDLDINRFLIYSYVCVDSENWNANNSFDDIEHVFVRFAKFLSSDDSMNLSLDKSMILSNWKYAKINVSRQGVALFASSADINNFTVLPDKYENEYLYTYIFNLYKRIYLKKMQYEVGHIFDKKSIRKKFVAFTKKLWVQEITEDEIGMDITYRLMDVWKFERMYKIIKLKYDVMYKDAAIQKNTRVLKWILLVLVLILIFNVFGFFGNL